MGSDPSTNGRQTDGRFAKGNPGGPGNPFAAKVGKYRARMYRAIKRDDIDLAIKTIRDICGGDSKDSDRLAAARLLLDRAIGPPVEADLIERLERLEQSVEGKKR
jgi:hypothetical protein